MIVLNHYVRHCDIMSYSMSSTISLKDRQTDATQRLIVSTAVELLETEGVTATTARAVAKKAGISERTVFRYYSSRDEFLDAVAEEAAAKMQTPPPPDDIAGLADYVSVLYRRFEEFELLLKESLHTEISKRIRATVARRRWVAVRELIDAAAPHRTARDRRIVATNISYYLSASTWQYYRFTFDLSPKDAERYAKLAVALFVENILKNG
jgi:AcrR family transcriptional regulator